MKLCTVLLLFLAVASVALCQFEVELNGMRIREPPSMRGEHEVAMGDFGECLLARTQTPNKPSRPGACCLHWT